MRRCVPVPSTSHISTQACKRFSLHPSEDLGDQLANLVRRPAEGGEHPEAPPFQTRHQIIPQVQYAATVPKWRPPAQGPAGQKKRRSSTAALEAVERRQHPRAHASARGPSPSRARPPSASGTARPGYLPTRSSRPRRRVWCARAGSANPAAARMRPCTESNGALRPRPLVLRVADPELAVSPGG